tara:strand:+ start:37 stop:684 length:648 start_codon:yes stop_codon:yes gene_type:complete
MPPNDWMKKYTGYLKDVEGKIIYNDKHVPYKDRGGKWTIGYGKLISESHLGKGKEKTIKRHGSNYTVWVDVEGGNESMKWDEKQAEESLKQEAESSLSDAKDYATKRGFNWESLSDRKKYGLADFVYNLGIPKMTTSFKYKGAIRKGQYWDTMGMYLRGDKRAITKGYYKRKVKTSKGNIELKGRNKKWKELFGGLGEDVAMGTMLQLDNPLGMV